MNSTPELTNEMLLHRLMAGDKKALLAIFDRYSPKLYSFILKEVSVLTPEGQAEEDTKNILKCVFASAWDNRNSISPHFSLEDYLFTITYYWIEGYVNDETLSS